MTSKDFGATLGAFRVLARAALQNLEAHRNRIDDLNVYPVPDGDTGTNLTLTLRPIVETAESSRALDRNSLAAEISHTALKAAKGNSGVIFSQIVRGFAGVLGTEEDIDAALVSRAFRSGSDAAYRAVHRVGPVEGTILTVIREMAEEGEKIEHQHLAPAELLRVVLARGEEALARTPLLLEVLARAGVVDAGGAGLVEIHRGVTLAARGEPLPESPAEAEPAVEAIHQELSKFRYCTGFVVEGEALDVAALEDSLAELGDSLLVVGDDSTLKVHVHTDDPGAALSVATAHGVIEEVEIANMHAQTAAREERLLGLAQSQLLKFETGVVAVSHGSGNRRLFEGENATVVDGGQTTNPSVGELVDAIQATPALAVIVLPNNSNVILAAEEAAKLAVKEVRVVPSRSVQAGLAAVMAYLPTSSLADNEREMLEAIGSVGTGEVTIASRDVELDGIAIREGLYLGLVDGKAVVCDADFESAAMAVVDGVLDGGRAHLDVLHGEGAPPLEAFLDSIGRKYPEVEITPHDGGQPHYPLLFVAE